MNIDSYGVLQQTSAASRAEELVEDLRRDGYAVLEGTHSESHVAEIAAAFDAAQAKYHKKVGGVERLAQIDEHNGVRLPLAFDQRLLGVAQEPTILEACRSLLGGYFILNQQNGVINPPRSAKYNQGKWHRDLPYQHLVVSRPIIVNALYCVDEFTESNGATLVLPSTHLQPDFPSERYVRSHAVQAVAPAGSYILMDGMTYHSGGSNSTEKPRRAINHVYSIPQIAQQIDIGAETSSWALDEQTRQFLGAYVQTSESVSDFLNQRLVHE